MTIGQLKGVIVGRVFTNKVHAVADANGLPVRLGLLPGEAHDNRLFSVRLAGLNPKAMALAGRGYGADWIRVLVSEQAALANIPPKRNRRDPIGLSPHLYRSRNLVERFFSRIKQCRRIATCYDKLTMNYLAFIKLASIRIWLRAYASTP
jgi:transposase